MLASSDVATTAISSHRDIGAFVKPEVSIVDNR